MKDIKSQVENDVKLLRNRVRMLQTEHERAHKKINETSKKAEMLERLKEENDARFVEKLELRERREQETVRPANGQTFAELRRQQQNQIKEARLSMYQIKRQEVKAVKQEMVEHRSKKRNDEDTE